MKDPMRCIVIGCGGIGTWFTQGLVRALEFGAPGSTVILIDGDTFESKNSERQVFSSLGSKAGVLRKDLAHHFPGTTIISKAAWVVAPGEEVERPEDEPGVDKISPGMFLQEHDHVFTLVDNYATRALLFDAAKDYENIDVYTGGNGEDLSGSIYHYIRKDGKEVTIHPSFYHEEFENPPDKNPGSMSCEERAKIEGGTQILAANMGVASLLLSKVSFYILGDEEKIESSVKMTEIQFDFGYGVAQPYDFRVEQSTSTYVDV